MPEDLTHKEFIKTATMGIDAVNTIGTFPEKVFAEDNLSVKTRYGTFNGFLDKNGVKTWFGIPYAQPPVEKLRWRDPQPLKTSNKTFDAKKLGFTAVQSIDDKEPASKNPQSEDCLTLNIWRRSDKKNLPVMVWIHGGGLVGGGTSDPLYNGSNFVAANDVILVSFNYRLNIFGFMNFAAIDKNFEDSSGYLGTKDQIAALKWIKENISEFGGNPDNITIFGESAGSISCTFLSIIPAAKNLFNKAIPQSGSLLYYSKPENSARLAEMFLEISGEKNVSNLMKKSTNELKNIYKKLTEMRESAAIIDFFPTCDGKFLPKDPLKALKDGAAREIKFLTGTTGDEYRYLAALGETFSELLRENYKKISPVMKNSDFENVDEIYKKWLKDRTDNEENFVTFANNVDWRIGQELFAEYQSNFNDVYFYLFSQYSAIENLRSCHMVDVPYTFNVGNDFVPNPDQNFARIIQASWAAFATTGNPNNELIPHWEKYSADNRQTMELSSKGCLLHKDLNTENLNTLRYVYESY